MNDKFDNSQAYLRTLLLLLLRIIAQSEGISADRLLTENHSAWNAHLSREEESSLRTFSSMRKALDHGDNNVNEIPGKHIINSKTSDAMK